MAPALIGKRNGPVRMDMLFQGDMSRGPVAELPKVHID